MFRQYKRFAGFKSMLLRKLWRLVQSHSGAEQARGGSEF
jgi:hypothetical protein